MNRKQIEALKPGEFLWTWEVIGNAPGLIEVTLAFPASDPRARAPDGGEFAFMRKNGLFFAYLSPCQLFGDREAAKADLIAYYGRKKKEGKSIAYRSSQIIRQGENL